MLRIHPTHARLRRHCSRTLADVLRVPSSCACSNADTGVLRAQSTHLWQTLVHVLAALGLMGLGCLWQLMNMSANFAHARRDMQRLSGPQTLVVAGVSPRLCTARCMHTVY